MRFDKKHGRDPRHSADERAALLFLADHPRMPAVLTVDDDDLVLEDVPGPSIAHLLLGDNRAAARSLVGRLASVWDTAPLGPYPAFR
jgi:hypothetical protein